MRTGRWVPLLSISQTEDGKKGVWPIQSPMTKLLLGTRLLPSGSSMMRSTQE